MNASRVGFFLFIFMGFATVGCGSSGDSDPPVPDTYRFERDGDSTVAYTGQTTRQVLIEDLVASMKAISDDVLAGRNLESYGTPEDVLAFLTPLYELGGGANPNRALPILVFDGDSMLQSTYADLNDANLEEKLAGNDAITDHKDWNGGDFVGWEDANLVVNEEGDLGAPQTPRKSSL